MAIHNELSSEIAAAIIAQKKPAQEFEQLREIILSVHSALQEMSHEAETSRTTKPSEHEKVGHRQLLHPTSANSD